MTNKLITLCVLLLSINSLYAQAQKAVQIKGELNNTKNKQIKLFKIVEGNMEAIATSTPQQDQKFGFTFYPEYEGIYAIGTGESGSQTENMIFYLKPGDQLELKINDLNYELIGKGNSKENQILEKWHKINNSIEDKAFSWQRVQSIYDDFFPDLEKAASESKILLQNNKSGNKAFDNLLPKIIKWDLAAYACNFLNTPRTKHPKIEELSAYYSTLSLDDFSKDAFEVYGMPWGNRTLSSVAGVFRRIKDIPYVAGIKGLQEDIKLFQNDTLKGDVVISYLLRQKDYGAYKEAVDAFSSLLLTESQKVKVKTIMNDMAQLKPGDQGLNFSFPDTEGKIVHFNDLKGKVVLVDVWATWCGPCKAEIPHLKKLEEEMKGTDVQIVSISVDEAKDKDKWLKMIKDENLGGLQLFASGWGDIANYYKIKGIPRFMLFDRQGKIVTIDSPRPSNPELKVLLNKILASK